MIKPSLLIILCLSLLSCSKSTTEKKLESLHVRPSAHDEVLYFTSFLQPLNYVVITSPVDGMITDINFQYGDSVKNKQWLFKIESEKFLTDYKTALADYIKAKNELNTVKNQITQAKFLHDHGLISDDEVKLKQSNFYSVQLSFLQAKENLKLFLKRLNLSEIHLQNMTIENLSKVMQLNKHFNGIYITAPMQGMFLSPMKNEEESKKINKGDVVKANAPLGIIANNTGFAIAIKVSELVIEQLKIGQKVIVKGAAFSDKILEGVVSRIDHQADFSNGNVPVFPVKISIKNLPAIDTQNIYIGMSVKVELHLDKKNYLAIPIHALIEKNGKTFVLKKIKNRFEQIEIQTGKTNAEEVMVLSGLKQGDEIVIPS